MAKNIQGAYALNLFFIYCKRFAKIIIINEWYLLSSLRFVTVHASNNTGNVNLTLK